MAIVHRRGWDAEACSESPWYFPIFPLWQALAGLDAFPSPERLSALYAAQLVGRAGVPAQAATLRFVATPPKPRRRARGPIDVDTLYEGRIVSHAEVPTRLNDWHDFFNALTFAAFPRSKWALHARQYALLHARVGPSTRRLPGARTREQDALSLFDEGGIALVVEPHALAALATDCDSFTARAAQLCQTGLARLVPFGHALYEHLVEGLPCPLGTLHVVPLQFRALANTRLVDAVDIALSRDLSARDLFTAPSPARGLALTAVGAA